MCLYLLEISAQKSRRDCRICTNFPKPETDRNLAEIELTTSNLYQNLIISEDAKTTAMLLNIRLNTQLESLIDQRDVLRAKRLDSNLSATELDDPVN